ncbi:MAG: mandelate racemase/muconate lactonizing enzyme family protein [Lautropia sp.]
MKTLPTIASIEAFPFQLPVRREFRWAGLHLGLGHFVCVRLRTSDGVEGYGEATPLPDWGGDHGRRGGETVRTVISVIDEILAPALIGEPIADRRRLHARMRQRLRGHSYAKCALDIAIHDALGQSLGVPIFQLLGGRYREQIPIAHMIGLMPPSDAMEEAARAAADGCTALQVKGGEDGDRDVALIQALRRELGDAIRLRLDANQGYREPRRALDIASRLRSAGLDYLEQPVEGLERMRAVQARSPVPIIADESCWDGHDALEIAGQRAADALSIYLAKAGGLLPATTVGALADLAGLPCDVNGSIESGIGNAANVQFAAAMPAVTLASVIPISAGAGQHRSKTAGRYFEDDVLIEPMNTRDCQIVIGDLPGLGVRIDATKLERYRIK